LREKARVNVLETLSRFFDRIPPRIRQRKFLATLFFMTVMALVYCLGDPALGIFRWHYLPEMVAYALMGLLLVDWRVSWKRVLAVYVAPLPFGYLAAGPIGVPLSLLLESPLIFCFFLGSRRRG